jgi:hypothetical protein
MTSFNNWRLHIDLGNLKITYANPASGPSSNNQKTTQGHGSEGGKREMKHLNEYIVATIVCTGAEIINGDLRVKDEKDIWHNCLWAKRYMNSKWPHHSSISEVEVLIKSARLQKMI